MQPPFQKGEVWAPCIIKTSEVFIVKVVSIGLEPTPSSLTKKYSTYWVTIQFHRLVLRLLLQYLLNTEIQHESWHSSLARFYPNFWNRGFAPSFHCYADRLYLPQLKLIDYLLRFLPHLFGYHWYCTSLYVLLYYLLTFSRKNTGLAINISSQTNTQISRSSDWSLNPPYLRQQAGYAGLYRWTLTLKESKNAKTWLSTSPWSPKDFLKTLYHLCA